MCLAIPSKVISIDKETNTATLDTLGVSREASLDLMSEEVKVGDYVLLHSGYVMGQIDEEQAKLSLETYEQIIKAIQEEEQEIQEANKKGQAKGKIPLCLWTNHFGWIYIFCKIFFAN